MCWQSILYLWLGVTVWPTAVAAEHNYRAALMQQTPFIDGKWSEEEWKGAVGFDGFTGRTKLDGWNGMIEARRARAYVGAKPNYIYVAIRSELPRFVKLRTQPTATLARNDSIEVWIDPTPGSEHGRTFQVLADSVGRIVYICHPRGRIAPDPQWNGNWKLAHHLGQRWWTTEIAIPIATIAPGRKANDGTWAINVCRNWKQPWAFSSLVAVDYRPNKIRFTFDDVAPVVQHVNLTDPTTRDIQTELRVYNPGTRRAQVKTSLVLERNTMFALKKAETLVVAPQETESVRLAHKEISADRFTLTANVTSADGEKTYYTRTYKWGPPRKRRWLTTPVVTLPVDFQFSHYPYLQKVRIQADWSGLKKDARLERLDFVIRTKETKQPVTTLTMTEFEGTKKEVVYEIPALDGEYQIVMIATGQGVPNGPLIKPFERKVFPWEHGTLGKSRKVYPPFEPIRVDGRRIRTVLREYTVGKLGLWDQVTSTGRDLLAAPMRLVSAGQEAQAANLRFTQSDPDLIKTASPLQLGALTGQVNCTWDYDGTMRVDLALEPNGGRPVPELVFEIPLKAAAAELYHAMGDGIRNTLYEKVPDGNGVIWTSAKVNVNDFPKSFCTYIYVGKAKRGLCWFAENDRGWSWDRNKPNVELVREGKTLTLRVHLINQPVVIDTPRRITFGVLAAPVKPRLEGWRYRWLTEPYSHVANPPNWFGLGQPAVYPAKKDMYLWEIFREGNRERLSRDEIDKAFEHAKPYWEPYGPEKVELLRRCVLSNLRKHHGDKMVFYYNRATYEAAEEYPTFKDEWLLEDYSPHHRTNDILPKTIAPSDSFIDYSLYWYGKSFDIAGNQGVYWDNMFFRASFNRSMTNAYKRPDGTIMPSTGVWQLREIAKRTFQFMNERGMVPITMAHMTSTNILPINAFCTVTYDWEWKYSTGDVQYRYPREYILLVSNGELAGSWPVLLGEHGDQRKDPWVQRTYAGVALVHELIADWMGLPDVWNPLLKPIQRLQQTPGIEVYRYWDERPQPIVADHPDLPGIVYVLPGKEAIYLVTSYAQEPLKAQITIDPEVLGLNANPLVTDIESGERIPIKNNRFSLNIPKHDVRELRITPTP